MYFSVSGSRPTASPSASASARYSSTVSSGGKRNRTFWYSKNDSARATGSRSTSTIRGRATVEATARATAAPP